MGSGAEQGMLVLTRTQVSAGEGFLGDDLVHVDDWPSGGFMPLPSGKIT